MDSNQTSLRRRLTLPLLVLYGVGVTIGAGIYVLIGAMAGHAGMRAPLAFVLAGVVMGLTAASYAELCTRFPVSAGEAAYVKAAFRSRSLSTMTGLLTIVIGVISAAAVSIGSAGYIREFIDLPQYIIVIAVVSGLGLIAAWGILESVVLAGLFTLVEIGGLVAIIVAGTRADLDVISALPQLLAPPLEMSAWAGIAFASLLAFDPSEVMEKVKQPVLIIHGELDTQVPAHHADKLAELARGRKKAAAVEVKRLPSINHLLVRATTGEVAEYGVLTERAITPEAGEAIAVWLSK